MEETGFRAWVKKTWHEGMVRHVVVTNKEGRSLVNLPLVVIIIAAVFAPWLLAAGVVVAVLTGAKMEVQREGDEEEDEMSFEEMVADAEPTTASEAPPPAFEDMPQAQEPTAFEDVPGSFDDVPGGSPPPDVPRE